MATVIVKEGSFDSAVRKQINDSFAALFGPFGKQLYVDGDSVSDGNGSLSSPKKTIQGAINAASAFDQIWIKPRKAAVGATDPVDYAEVLSIPASKPGLRLVGWAGGPAQGAQPQVKMGSGSTALLTVQAPGCLIHGLSFNGAGATGGGVLLDDDASTKSAFGTIIENCFFKNCKGSGNASTGGAIQWAATGGAWQVLVRNCRLFNNRAGVVLLGTSGSRPKDVVFEDLTFGSDVNTVVDADFYLAGGSGMEGMAIRRCSFQTVDVPAYATSPAAARYLDLTSCEGALEDCYFACVVSGSGAKTFKAAGDGAKIPTTVRIVGCQGECASDGSRTEILRAA